MYHRLGCFGVFRQFVEVDIRLIAVIVIDVRNDGFTKHIGINSSTVTFYRNIGNAIGIKPLYVIFGVTLFGGLFGIVGMLIGPPLMAIIIELVQEFVGDRERVKAVKEGLETGDPEVDPDENPDLYVKSLSDDESHES